MNGSHVASFCFGLMIVGSGNAMDKNIFNAGSFVRVVRGPNEMQGKIMEVLGTTKDIWGIDDVYGSTEAISIGALRKYFLTNAPDDGGIVYYARDVMSPMKDCIHESWVEPEKNFDRDDMAVRWELAWAGGKLVQKVTTLRESRKENERRAQQIEPLDFGQFKKEYIDNYFSDVTVKKNSLIELAPADLKKWFEGIRDSQRQQPLLVYGAYGVGKTMTIQALTRDANARLCYIGTQSVMRNDWNLKRFESKHLALIDDNTCVIIDNIESLAADDVENISALADLCNAKKNLYLLAIAYHAKKHMPSTLYDRFESIKFPMPDKEQKLKLLKKSVSNTKLADDADDAFLNNFLERVPDCNARTIQGISSTARICFRHDNEQGETILSRDNFEKALKKHNRKREQMQIEFDECE